MSGKEGDGPSTESSSPAKTPQVETSPSKRPPSIFDWGLPDPLINLRGKDQTPIMFGGDIGAFFDQAPVGKTINEKPTGPVSNQGTVVELPGKKGPK